MKKDKIGIDMDDCIADFSGAARDPVSGKIREFMMWDKDFFLNLKPVPGAQGAIFELGKLGYDLYIVSQPLAESPESYVEKAKWIQIHFPQLYKKIILTQDKGLIKLDYLIDDNQKKWGARFATTGGTFVHFPYGAYNGDLKDHIAPDKIWRDLVLYFHRKSQLE